MKTIQPRERVTTLKAFDEMKEHLGHTLTVVTYAEGSEVAIECEDCGEVIVSIEKE